MAAGNSVNVWETESCYKGDGTDCLLGTLSSIFWPNLVEQGVRSIGGALYWIRYVEAFTDLVSPNSKASRIATLPIVIYAIDLFLRSKKNHIGPTMTLEQAQMPAGPTGGGEKEEDQLLFFPITSYTR